jgi:hypothetical protein
MERVDKKDQQEKQARETIIIDVLERGKRREQSRVTSKDISGGVQRGVVQRTAIFCRKRGETLG